MPKITVMSAEKAFLAAHYGGPFDFNKEDYIIVSITDTLIQNDYCTERYDDWKTYPSFLVQGALIDKGLYLDYFSQSTDPNIQEAIQEYEKGQSYE